MRYERKAKGALLLRRLADTADRDGETEGLRDSETERLRDSETEGLRD
jgi:hypothetical protein